ncbi:MAG: hypothetical protein O2895_00200 [Chloroflexi bacterium]|nr:hypothetical protein [Chloroflexota bacterium]
MLVVVASGALQAARPPAAADAAHGVFHVPARGRWEVLAGYNTSSHSGEDPHALDLVRRDAATAGSQLLAPLSGRIAWVGSDCIGISDDHGATIHLCHVVPAAGLDRKDRIEVDEVIGSVAPDGLANNNGMAHIHMAVFVGGRTVPFTGLYAIEGRTYAATSAWNAYYGELLLSNNTGGATNSGAGSFSVEIGEDLEIAAGASVTLNARPDTGDDILAYEWSQIAGPSVAVSDSGRTISFVAPAESGATLIFRVIVLSTFQRTGSASIVVAVGPSGAASAPPAPAPAAEAPAQMLGGQILGGQIPAAGFGLVVFGGGSGAQLLAASGCAAGSARFWATVGGRFVVYIPAAQVAAVNGAWDAAFDGGIPAHTPLLGRCA